MSVDQQWQVVKEMGKWYSTPVVDTSKLIILYLRPRFQLHERQGYLEYVV
jgi:hypothetical protein